jgi:mono/diheme cytochrome c family protein
MDVCRHGLARLAYAAACAAACAPLQAAPPRSVAAGEKVARNVCAACHVVASDQAPPPLSTTTPSFTEIANRPGVSEKTLRPFIMQTHWDMKTLPLTMPNPMLTQEQATDVARYILSLRNPQ